MSSTAPWETLPKGAPPGAFNALSGEVHAGAASALQQAGQAVRGLAFSRLRSSLDAGMLPGAPTAAAGGALGSASDAIGPGGGASAVPCSAALPAWAEVIGNWQTLDGDGNASRIATPASSAGAVATTPPASTCAGGSRKAGREYPRPDQSRDAPESATTFCHLTSSRLMCSRNSAGELPTGLAPMPEICSTTLGSFKAAAISL